MCGICGAISRNYHDTVIADNMVRSITHRGPDNQKVTSYTIGDSIVQLCHARLSIIDLRSISNQPMEFQNLTIVFNGEIYNYKEIRERLETMGHKFITTSDTEVILHAFKEWGMSCVDIFIGMYAFAIYDRCYGKLYLCRDRSGVKPLYYYYNNGNFLFASELKCFHEHPAFISSKKLNSISVDLYFRLGYIPAPNTIFENCYKLESSNWLIYDINKHEYSIHRYWDVKEYYLKPKLLIDYDEAKSVLKELFTSAFNYRMVADVPVGIFLSGGYDSTLVTSILQSSNSAKINTFTIGFEEGNSEAIEARQIANILGTNHTEYFCHSNEAKDIISTLPFFYDEPFSDSSNIPTTLISRIASRDVKVVLSADGGDEYFYGYNAYDYYRRLLKLSNVVPKMILGSCFKIISSVSSIAPFVHSKAERRLYKLKSALLTELADEKYYSLITDNTIYHLLINNSNQNRIGTLDSSGIQDFDIPQFIDYNFYMQDDILTKVDRATMSCSIEGREPLIDHRIIEFAAQLPDKYKYQAGTKKRIIRDIVHDYIPENIMNKPKRGFSVPMTSWLQKDLNYLINRFLSKQMIDNYGILNYAAISSIIKRFEAGTLPFPDQIWKLIVFQMWAEKWL